MRILTRVRDYPHELISPAVAAIHGNLVSEDSGEWLGQELVPASLKKHVSDETWPCQGVVALG